MQSFLAQSWRVLPFWGRGLETIKKTRKHTIKQAKGTTQNHKKHKHSIKQTINQAHHQSNQTVSKERKQTNPKKKPYIKQLATPDRPPPAAVMLGNLDTTNGHVSGQWYDETEVEI